MSDAKIYACVIFGCFLVYGFGNSLTLYITANYNLGTTMIEVDCTPIQFELSDEYWTVEKMIHRDFNEYYDRANRTRYYYKYGLNITLDDKYSLEDNCQGDCNYFEEYLENRDTITAGLSMLG